MLRECRVFLSLLVSRYNTADSAVKQEREVGRIVPFVICRSHIAEGCKVVFGQIGRVGCEGVIKYAVTVFIRIVGSKVGSRSYDNLAFSDK